jgi:hypothetical protein
MPVVSVQTAVVQAAPTSNQGGGASSGSGTGSGDGIASISTEQIKASLARQMVPLGQVAKIGALLKRGGYILSFNAPEAGRLSVQWYELPPGAKLAKTKAKPVLVASGKLTFKAGGTGKIKIMLTARGRRVLRQARRMKLMSKVVFRTSNGIMVVATKNFVVRA